MANRIPMRPPKYRGNDQDKKAVSDYLEYLYQTLDYQLSEIHKALKTLQTTNTEEG